MLCSGVTRPFAFFPLKGRGYARLLFLEMLPVLIRHDAQNGIHYNFLFCNMAFPLNFLLTPMGSESHQSATRCIYTISVPTQQFPTQQFRNCCCQHYCALNSSLTCNIPLSRSVSAISVKGVQLVPLLTTGSDHMAPYVSKQWKTTLKE